MNYEPNNILGKIAEYYGEPIEEKDFFKLKKNPKDSFILKINNDKHKHVFLFENDYIIINPNQTPEDDNLVVLEVENSIIIKKHLQKDDKCELNEDNKKTIPVEKSLFENKFKIIGVIVSVFNKIL